MAKRLRGILILLTMLVVLSVVFGCSDIDNQIGNINNQTTGGKDNITGITQPVNPEEDCNHEWIDATCESPKTCSKCEAVEGEKLSHVEVVIEAEKDSSFWSIPACLFKNLVDESLAVSNYSRNLLSSNFSELMWLMEQIMWKSFDKRLAAFLLEEATIEGSPNLQITHEKIAAHMGTAREVVTRMLRYFQSEGMVKLNRGTVDLVDRKRLEALQD